MDIFHAILVSVHKKYINPCLVNSSCIIVIMIVFPGSLIRLVNKHAALDAIGQRPPVLCPMFWRSKSWR